MVAEAGPERRGENNRILSRKLCSKTQVQKLMLTLPFILSVLDAAIVRPLPCQVHGLSFFEFARHFQMKQAWHPLTAHAHEAHMLKPELYEAKLTDAGTLL
jgi:hypothetical protein